MLHMLRVVVQLTNQTVIVLVSLVAERLLTLHDDHRNAVGIGFFEVLAHALHRLHRRRIFGTHRYGMSFLNPVE